MKRVLCDWSGSAVVQGKVLFVLAGRLVVPDLSCLISYERRAQRSGRNLYAVERETTHTLQIVREVLLPPPASVSALLTL